MEKKIEMESGVISGYIQSSFRCDSGLFGIARIVFLPCVLEPLHSADRWSGFVTM